MRRRDLSLCIGLSALAWPGLSRAQSERPRRIGLLGSQPLKPIQSFKQKIAELGYQQGRNVEFVDRYAEGRDDLFPAYAAELVAAKVDAMIAWGTPAALAAKRATSVIPIVVVAGEVVETGIVANIAKPEANITGFVAINVALEEKRFELLKEVVPTLRRVAVMANSLNPLNKINLQVARRVAADFKLAIDVFEVRNSGEVEGALEKLVASRPDAALMASDVLLLTRRKLIADTMAQHRIPAIYPFREYAEAGGFIMYGANISILFQRAAEYVDRILKGEKPGNLPVQQATAFELILNLKAAGRLGLAVPQMVQVRADEVIE